MPIFRNRKTEEVLQLACSTGTIINHGKVKSSIHEGEGNLQEFHPSGQVVDIQDHLSQQSCQQIAPFL